ncbi:TetR/AcrR family transcriptional regulator [Nakamurella lactea]|uniref:TetR/AcrR family transcriptional regulator n=1 Tax=Nakamurella lactea TaxID=459515 RepID=UPI000412362F|nr:TetR/AcrR family transcriptional regulator [Nakamurella lactea]
MANPGRGGRLSRDDRRAQLLAAARSVFVEQGYHAAAMDDIAERAGVSKPVLYQHFPSKLELYQALLDESANDMVARVRAALAATEDNHDRVHRTIEAYYEFVAGDDQAYRLIFESDLRGQPDVQAAVDRAIDGCLDALTETITQDTGVDSTHSRLLASALVGLSQVSARYWLSQGAQIPRAAAVDLLSTLAWRGISGFPRQS